MPCCEVGSESQTGYGVLTVDLCRLILGELCDIIQELEQGLELGLVTVTVTVIVIVIA